MQRLMDLTKGQERVFIELDTKEKRLAFLKQAEEEGFTTMLYHSKQSAKVKYE